MFLWRNFVQVRFLYFFEYWNRFRDVLDEENDIKIMPKSKTFDDENTISFKNLSFINHIADNPHSHAGLSTLASVRMIILAVYLVKIY